MKTYLQEQLALALRALGIEQSGPLALEKPKQEAHGDLTTNIALVAAKSLGRKPREFAEQLVATLKLDPALVRSVAIAGPGFINFTLAPTVFTRHCASILSAGPSYGRNTRGKALKARPAIAVPATRRLPGGHAG